MAPASASERLYSPPWASHRQAGWRRRVLATAVVLTVSTAPTGAQPGAEIGAYYFHSARLSADGMLACVTCHRSEAAFQDGLERALARQHVLPRNTPSLLNLHRHQVYFWDGRATSLEEQVDGPLLSRVELNSSTAHMLSATQSCPEVEHAWRSSPQPMIVSQRVV